MRQNIDFLARAWVLSKTVGTITDTDHQVIICKTNEKIVQIQESILHSPISTPTRQLSDFSKKTQTNNLTTVHQNNHFTSGLAQIIKWEQALEEDKNIDEEVAKASLPAKY